MKTGEIFKNCMLVISKDIFLTTVAVDKVQQVYDDGYDEEVGGESYHPYHPVARVETEDRFHV